MQTCLLRASRPLVAALACAAAALVAAPSQAKPPIALVETAPVETALDHPDIPNAHAVWLEMIGAAKERLDIGQFYVISKDGSRLAAVLEAIEAAARRGVKVRVLAERIFYKKYPDDLDRLKGLSNVEVVIWRTNKTLGGILHAKYFVVDRREAFLGSQNFDWRSLEHIQELGLRLREPSLVGALADIFETDWALAQGGDPSARTQSVPADTFPVTAELGGAPASLTFVASPRGWLPDESLWDLPRLVKLIDDAEKTVRVQLLSYDPDKRFMDLDDALRRAGMRGVEVQLMVAHWSQKPKRLSALSSLQQELGVEVKLVTIPEHSGGFIPFARVIHTKMMVVDGAHAWLGTSNWGGDYFHKSRNVGVIATSAPLAARLDRYFAHTWKQPYAVTVEPGRSYPEPRIAE